MTTDTPFIEVKNLSFSYQVKKKTLQAVKNVNFTIKKGETLGLVGESGCGKTTIGKLLLNILQPSHGKLLINGILRDSLNPEEQLKLKQKIQMVYQDPYSSLNPRMTIEEILSEPLIIFSLVPNHKRKNRIEELLDLVGLDNSFSRRYPHQLSGGQRQRIVIARALASNPQFLICDEPIAALDVSIQAQIINLLKKLQKDLNLTYLFISHDLSIVKYLSNNVAVMYLGEIIEKAPSTTLYQQPLHPYTQALLSSIPTLNTQQNEKNQIHLLENEMPSPFSTLEGCPFFNRCPKALKTCKTNHPSEVEISKQHKVSCHLCTPIPAQEPHETTLAPL